MQMPRSLMGRGAPLLLAVFLTACGASSGTTKNALIARAGNDQSVPGGALVTLDASGSTGPDGDSLTYVWTQTGGPAVTLSDPAAEKPTFTAPRIAGGMTLDFKLTVSDGKKEASDDVIVTVNDVTPPTWTVSHDIGVNDDIVIHFDESIDTASLSLAGDLAALADSQMWSQTTVPDDTLTLSPPADGWYSGWQTLKVSVKDTSGNATSDTTTFAVRLKFDDFQAASVVIGQTDFTGMAANQGGATAADTLDRPAGDPVVIDGRLWIPDTSNQRVLGYEGIPTANDASAGWVIGQTSFTGNSSGRSASKLNGPIDVAWNGSDFYLDDVVNSRILIYAGVPLSAPGTAGHVVGQVDLNSAAKGCASTSLKNPFAIVTVAGKLIVSDFDNNRILIWNAAPTGTNDVPADRVLGQGDFTHCTADDDNQDGSIDLYPTARTLSYPKGIWSDGTRLVVADTLNNRVLIWNTFPTSNFQPADVVLGQGDFTHNEYNDDNQDNNAGPPTARTLFNPATVWSNGLQLIVTDAMNNRVLIWNNFPTTNFQPADVVLGQSTFFGQAANDGNQDGVKDATPSARTLYEPWGLGVYRNKLLVGDFGNSRVLVFDSH